MGWDISQDIYTILGSGSHTIYTSGDQISYIECYNIKFDILNDIDAFLKKHTNLNIDYISAQSDKIYIYLK